MKRKTPLIFNCLTRETTPFVYVNTKKKKKIKNKLGKKARKNLRKVTIKQQKNLNKLKRIEKREKRQSYGIKTSYKQFFPKIDKRDFVDYIDYINSDEWSERKKLYYKTNKKKCICCDSTKNIHLHHITYNSLGNEKDKDLAPMCEKCHKEFHKTHKHNDKLGFLRFARNIRLSLD